MEGQPQQVGGSEILLKEGDSFRCAATACKGPCHRKPSRPSGWPCQKETERCHTESVRQAVLHVFQLYSGYRAMVVVVVLSWGG